MKTRIRVWHINNLRMMDPVTFSTDTYTAVADIATEAPALATTGGPPALDEAYGRSQHLSADAWFAADGITKLVDHDRVRSTSVGDVLEILIGSGALSGALYLVKGFGFERIDPLTAIDWTKAHGV